MLMTPIRPYVIASPRATRSSTEPRLMPVKTTARRSPQASRSRTDAERLLQRRAHFGIALAAGREALLQQAGDGALVAARQLGGGGEALRAVGRRDEDASRASARAGSSAPASVSAANAFSTSGSCDSSSDALASSSTAPRRTPTSGDSTRRPASAASSAPRMRLLLVTSSAPSGSGGRRAARRVDRLAVVDDEDLVAGDLDLVVEHRLHEARPGARRRAPRPR